MFFVATIVSYLANDGLWIVAAGEGSFGIGPVVFGLAQCAARG